MKTRILILYDYFDPAYKAGGPIRSLVNLVKLLDGKVELHILSTNQDHDGTVLAVTPDIWLDYGTSTKVKYLSPSKRSYHSIKKEFNDIHPTVVYLNGIFSLPFVVYPLAIVRNQRQIKTVIAPRGMLQTQSLMIRPWKKSIYLAAIRFLFLHHKIVWHCTTPQEQSELANFTKYTSKVKRIGNVPHYLPEGHISTKSNPKQPVFGTVALISPMKNIHNIINALSQIKADLNYSLYGPVKDTAYWQECQKLIARLPSNIRFEYHGSIQPHEVEKMIAGFDFYIQPSKSENFGHSIFEAFNQGVPVIISDQTPWKNLYAKHAGWDVDVSKSGSLESAIRQSLAMDDDAYLRFRRGARAMAEQYMADNDFEKDYTDLFS